MRQGVDTEDAVFGIGQQRDGEIHVRRLGRGDKIVEAHVPHYARAHPLGVARAAERHHRNAGIEQTLEQTPEIRDLVEFVRASERGITR